MVTFASDSQTFPLGWGISLQIEQTYHSDRDTHTIDILVYEDEDPDPVMAEVEMDIETARKVAAHIFSLVKMNEGSD